MTDTDWKQWPQLEFDIDYFEDVQDWVVNRFGDNTSEVILVGKGTYNFVIAIRDPKILNFAILKFKECTVRPNEYDQEIIREEVKKQTDIEIKKLIEELQVKLKNVKMPTFEQVKDAARKDAFFSYNNGVWNNVEE